MVYNNANPGECLEKSIMPNEYETQTTTYNVFTGDVATENVDVEEVSIEISAANTKWVKKKADRNCLSSDPNDCLVWCLVEVPAVTENFTILKDVSQSKNYEVKEIKKEILTKKGGYEKWQKVICKNQITPSVVSQLHQSLSEKGYTVGAPSKKINRNLKSAIFKYQRENLLPANTLNLKTLNALGISY